MKTLHNCLCSAKHERLLTGDGEEVVRQQAMLGHWVQRGPSYPGNGGPFPASINVGHRHRPAAYQEGLPVGFLALQAWAHLFSLPHETCGLSKDYLLLPVTSYMETDFTRSCSSLQWRFHQDNLPHRAKGVHLQGITDQESCSHRDPSEQEPAPSCGSQGGSVISAGLVQSVVPAE